MFIERNPRRVAEDLHATTSIPCSAFSLDGRLLYSGGNHFLHDDYELYNQLVGAMSHPTEGSAQTTRIKNDAGREFTAYYINKHRYEDGFILLGPYTEADLANVSQFDVCFYSNQTPDPVGARLLHRPMQGCGAAYSLNIRKAVNHIHENYKEILTLDEMVGQLGLNKSYFCTLFKKETGQTFTAYLNNVRVEKSKRQLLKGRSVLDVALSVGFSSQNYYTVTFKKIMKMTPLEFRRQASA